MIRQPGADVDSWARAVIGAAIEVHSLLGPGLLETVYEEALCVEMQPLTYKGQEIGQGRLDLLVADSLIVELKTVEALAPVHMAQVLSYLRATGRHLGLLINFNVTALKQGGVKRVVLTKHLQTSLPILNGRDNRAKTDDE
jgi:GxxExxY protein